MSNINENYHIHIVDSIMGSGKSRAAINFINSSDNDAHFIYVTPFLSEVNRIITSCVEKKFYEPKNIPKKIDSLKKLLKKGRNIVTTHALFHLFDQDIIDLCYSQGYTLILDEVTDVVKQHSIGKKDLEILLTDFVNVDQSGTLVWKEEQKDYADEKFKEEKILCDLKSLTLYADTALLWMFPIEIFRAFKETYLLTYLFDGQVQKYYYDYYNLSYDYYYVFGDNYQNYHFTESKNEQIKKDYQSLINIEQSDKLNRIGELEYALTKRWYEKHCDDILIKTLQNHTYNYFFNILQSKSEDNMWTTFKDYQHKLKGKGYTKGYLSSNARATNDYKDRHNVAYLINKYYHPIIKHFFLQKDIEVNEDLYALSEMLQFIWRSAIREYEPINVYIPSRRMRMLLENWIEQNSHHIK